jgi:hypothetical protein
VSKVLSNDAFGEFTAPRLLANPLVNTATREEVLRETVKVAKFELPPDALPEPPAAPDRDAVEVTMKRLKAPATTSPNWERRVAAALWAIAAAIVATLWFAQT